MNYAIAMHAAVATSQAAYIRLYRLYYISNSSQYNIIPIIKLVVY